MTNIYNYLHFFSSDIISLDGSKEISVPFSCRNNNSHFITDLHYKNPNRASIVWNIFTRLVTHALPPSEQKSDELFLEEIMRSLSESTPLFPVEIEFVVDTANDILATEYAHRVQDLLKSLLCQIFQLYLKMVNLKIGGFPLIVEEDIYYPHIHEKDKLTIASYISNNVQRQHDTMWELNSYWEEENGNNLLILKPYLGILEYIIKSHWLMNDDSFISKITNETSYSLLILDSIELFPVIKYHLHMS